MSTGAGKGHCADCGVAIHRDSRRCKACAMAHAMLLRRLAQPLVIGHCSRCGVGGVALVGLSPRCAPCTADWRRDRITHCALDGLLLTGHPQCAVCEALTGSKHTQQMAAGGVCTACFDFARRVADRRVQWAS